MTTKIKDDPLWQQWAHEMGRLTALERCAVCGCDVTRTRHKAEARCCTECASTMTLDLTNTAVVPRRVT